MSNVASSGQPFPFFIRVSDHLVQDSVVHEEVEYLSWGRDVSSKVIKVAGWLPTTLPLLPGGYLGLRVKPAVIVTL